MSYRVKSSVGLSEGFYFFFWGGGELKDFGGVT